MPIPKISVKGVVFLAVLVAFFGGTFSGPTGLFCKKIDAAPQKAKPKPNQKPTKAQPNNANGKTPSKAKNAKSKPKIRSDYESPMLGLWFNPAPLDFVALTNITLGKVVKTPKSTADESTTVKENIDSTLFQEELMLGITKEFSTSLNFSYISSLTTTKTTVSEVESIPKEFLVNDFSGLDLKFAYQIPFRPLHFRTEFIYAPKLDDAKTSSVKLEGNGKSGGDKMTLGFGFGMEEKTGGFKLNLSFSNQGIQKKIDTDTNETTLTTLRPNIAFGIDGNLYFAKALALGIMANMQKIGNTSSQTTLEAGETPTKFKSESASQSQAGVYLGYAPLKMLVLKMSFALTEAKSTTYAEGTEQDKVTTQDKGSLIALSFGLLF